MQELIQAWREFVEYREKEIRVHQRGTKYSETFGGFMNWLADEEAKHSHGEPKN